VRKNEKNILVIGIGNDILTDDGIGPKLCDFLKDHFKNSAIDFEKLNVGGLEILEFIQGYKKVIFIDAIKTRQGNIGDVYVFTPKDFKETANLSNLHDTSFLTALELGKSMEFNIPDQIYIIAVEIKEDMVFSEYFTEELESNLPEILERVADVMNDLLAEDLLSHTKKKTI
jgi:hydrogenase maturation protease